MKIIAFGTKDRAVVQSAEWTHVAVFDAADGSTQEVLVQAENAFEVGQIVVGAMPKTEKVCIIGKRAGTNLGGVVEALLGADGTLRLVRGDAFEDSLFWTYEEVPGSVDLSFGYGQRDKAA